LLPEGAATGAVVLGDGCPAVLASPKDPGGSDTVDLVIVAPSRSQRRDPRWTRDAAAITISRLSRAGFAYVVPGGARRLRRALVAAGLPHAATLLHVPDEARPRYLVPVGTDAERWALADGIAMRRRNRLLASVLGARGRSAFGPTGAIHRRDPESPLATWLQSAGGSGRSWGSTIVALPHSGSGAILYRFAAGGQAPDAVAKLTPGAGAELEALRRIAPRAGDAGARVPVVLESGHVGSTEFVLESVVGGRSAAAMVATGKLPAEELQDLLASWLETWNRSSARERPIDRDDVERFLLGPASRAAVNGRQLAFLRQLGARALGRSCPFVAVHGDLTLANVLVDDNGALGVVDWEHSSEESLPLTDLLYAGVDAAAAQGRYADRPGAFGACCTLDDGEVSPLQRLVRRSAAALGLDEVVQALCFHACWLHHAANETDRSTGSARGPFVTILETMASTPERFGLPRGA
jgi:aminoglycoside phosphotransferase (APT) family kinase protein